MADHLFDSLSARQLECLRLVGRGFNTKEIAIELGISPETARSHIDAARMKLGAANRGRAARLLVEHEASRPPRPTGTPSEGIASACANPDDRRVSIEDGEAALVLHDAAVPAYLATSDRGSQIRWPFRTPGRRFSDLAWYEQLGWAVAIAFGSIVSVHELISVLAG